jgi:hypothetical protein
MNALGSARRALLLARGGTIVAATLLVVAVARRGGSTEGDALPLEPVRSSDVATKTGSAASNGAGSVSDGSAGSAPVDIARIFAGDPFSPVRAAPEVPYRLGAVEPVVRRVVAVPQQVRLLGTVVRPTGRSFAMCQVATGPATVVYPGQRIGGLLLESVAQGSAVFIDDEGTRVTLRVPGNGR